MIDKQAAREQVKQQERELRRSIIFNGAMKAFAVYGFEATTMDHIAAMVGLAKGTLYKSFASKEELFLSLVTSLLCSQLDFVEAILDDHRLPVRERLTKCLQGMLKPDGALVNARTISVSVTPQMFELAPEETRRAYLHAVARMGAIFERFVDETKAFPNGARVEASTLAAVLQGFKHELGLRACLHPESECSATEQINVFVDFLLDSLLRA